MSKSVKKGLVPERRFPGFKDAGEWESERFEKIYSLKTTNSLSRDKLNYKQGTVKNIHYGDIHTKFSILFDIKKEIVPYINPTESLEKIKPESYCIEGDMIFADASEDIDDVGKSIEIIALNNEELVSGLHTLLARQRKKKLIIGFGGYLFKSNRIREQIKKESQGAKVLGLSGGRLSSISVAYPADGKEQQKIADCLTTADKLITAETQKLDALKTHKKGLMQQLFPAEGETVPKHRFPEFRGKGEWKLKELGQLATYTKGFAFKSQDYRSDGIRIVRVSDLGADFIKSDNEKIFIDSESAGDYERYKLHKGEIIITTVGSKPEMVDSAVGRGIFVHYSNEDLLNQNLLKLKVLAEVNSRFLFSYINATGYQEFIASISRGNANQANIAVKELMKFELKAPSPDEQQKIADCLTSVDELITNQAQKVESLKSHKKGLMQQLFPAMDEVGA